MPESEKSTLLDRLIQFVFRECFGSITKYVEGMVRRQIRWATIGIGGALIALLGVAFIARGVVKLFTLLMPTWLAWLIVGVILLLLGASLAFASLGGSRS